MEKISVSWLDENKTAILCTYHQDGWSWEDFYSALQHQKALIDSVNNPNVDIIVDVRKSSWMPKGGSLLSGMRKFKFERHQRQGQTIVVGARGMIAAIASTVSKLMGSSRLEMHFATTMDEMQTMINQFENERREKNKLIS